MKHLISSVIGLYGMFANSTNLDSFTDVYLVSNRMQADLSNFLKKSKLNLPQIVFFTYQIFRGLKYLHSSNIIHRV